MSGSAEIWKQAVLPPDSTVQEAIRNLDRVGIRIVLVLNKNDQLIGTISDGDIRRGLLRGLYLTSSIETIIHHNALVVPTRLTREAVVQLMIANKIHQIPIVDENQRVVGLHLWDEPANSADRSNLMVIMAGGKGVRLLPYTQNCPKPLVKVAGKPMLQHIIERAKSENFSHFLIAINHLGHMLEDYFGDGSRLGVHIKYLREQSPMGTAGALSLLKPKPESSFVVTNGDVLTDVHYGKLLDFHVRYNAVATMAVRIHEWQHPFGVVNTRGADIVGFEEKPTIRSHINAGIYALSPDALDELFEKSQCDMPTLFQRLQDKSKRIVAYPMHEPWLDIGRPDDLIKANKESLPPQMD